MCTNRSQELIEIRDLLTTSYTSGIHKKPETDAREWIVLEAQSDFLDVWTRFQYVIIESDGYSRFFSCSGYTLTLKNPYKVEVSPWVPRQGRLGYHTDPWVAARFFCVRNVRIWMCLGTVHKTLLCIVC